MANSHLSIRQLVGVLIIPGLLFLTGCVRAPLNVPLEKASLGAGYRYANVSRVDDDGVLVALFFSGGGTRAAAFSYGVMKELAQTPLTGGRRLLDDVTIINAVSGGCFPAAYYCLHGDRLFVDFETLFLKRKVQSTLTRRVLATLYNARLLSDYYGRSDMAADLYDEILFKGATFGDLLKSSSANKPFLVINATDVKTGACFVFTQDQFDLIGSDLSRFPISRAVAASSAVPVILTPIVLRNYADPGLRAPTVWLAPEPGRSSGYSILQDSIARVERSLVDAKENPYLHLVDGGLSDNLGLKNLLDVVVRYGGWESMARQLSAMGKKRMVILLVNSATQAPHEWAREPNNAPMGQVLRSMANSMMNRRNDDIINQVKASLAEWRERNADAPVSIDFVVVDFEGIKDPTQRAFFTRIPTSFQLPSETIDQLVDMGARLLRENPDFLRVMAEINTGRQLRLSLPR